MTINFARYPSNPPPPLPINKSDSNQKLALIPTFLTFIYGESGAGKTTISKAIFQATNSDRYVNVPNSTSASMQNALTEANSGVVLYDDIPHAGYDKCSSENKDKLELLIRSVGDMGAERRTARKSNSRPFSKRAMTAVTSEAPFFISESSTLRCLFINIKKEASTWKSSENIVIPVSIWTR